MPVDPWGCVWFLERFLSSCWGGGGSSGCVCALGRGVKSSLKLQDPLDALITQKLIRQTILKLIVTSFLSQCYITVSVTFCTFIETSFLSFPLASHISNNNLASSSFRSIALTRTPSLAHGEVTKKTKQKHCGW